MEMRKVLLAAVTALALVGGYGCASDCEVVCDKAVECVPETDREACISTCDASAEADADCASSCADCYGDAECEALLAGEACTTECACDAAAE